VGLKRENLRLYEVPKEELAHYSKRTVDVMYHYPIGWESWKGSRTAPTSTWALHSRDQGSLGLTRKTSANHHSTEKLTTSTSRTTATSSRTSSSPSAGVDRGVLAALCEAYDEEKLENGETRVVLRLKPALAPIKVAVLPLKRTRPKSSHSRRASRTRCRPPARCAPSYDDSAGIGKLYRRQGRDRHAALRDGGLPVAAGPDGDRS
jgi:glycyl-tRNA synthetase